MLQPHANLNDTSGSNPRPATSLPNLSGSGDRPKAAHHAVSNLPPLSLKEMQEELSNLRKENFGLKMKIYYLEENDASTFYGNDEHRMIVDMEVRIKQLEDEISQKNETLETRERLASVAAHNDKMSIDALQKDVGRLQHHIEKLEVERVQMNKELEFARDKMDGVASTSPCPSGNDYSVLEETASGRVMSQTDRKIEDLQRKVIALEQALAEAQAVKSSPTGVSSGIGAMKRAIDELGVMGPPVQHGARHSGPGGPVPVSHSTPWTSGSKQDGGLRKGVLSAPDQLISIASSNLNDSVASSIPNDSIADESIIYPQTAQLKSKMKILEDRISKYDQERKLIIEQRDVDRELLEDYRKQVAGLENTIADEKRKTDEKNNEIAALNELMAELETKLNDLEKERPASSAECVEQHNVSADDNDNFFNVSNATSPHSNALKQAVRRLECRRTNDAMERVALEKKITLLEQEIDEILEKLDSANMDRDRLSADLAELKADGANKATDLSPEMSCRVSGPISFKTCEDGDEAEYFSNDASLVHGDSSMFAQSQLPHNITDLLNYSLNNIEDIRLFKLQFAKMNQVCKRLFDKLRFLASFLQDIFEWLGHNGMRDRIESELSSFFHEAFGMVTDKDKLDNDIQDANNSIQVIVTSFNQLEESYRRTSDIFSSQLRRRTSTSFLISRNGGSGDARTHSCDVESDKDAQEGSVFRPSKLEFDIAEGQRDNQIRNEKSVDGQIRSIYSGEEKLVDRLDSMSQAVTVPFAQYDNLRKQFAELDEKYHDILSQLETMNSVASDGKLRVGFADSASRDDKQIDLDGGDQSPVSSAGGSMSSCQPGTSPYPEADSHMREQKKLDGVWYGHNRSGKSVRDKLAPRALVDSNEEDSSTASLTATLAKLVTQLGVKDEEINRLKSELLESHNSSTDFAEAHDQLGTLLARIDELTRENNCIKEQTDQLVNQLASSESSQADLRKSLVQLDDAKTVWLAREGRLTEQLEKALNEVDRMERELRSAREEFAARSAGPKLRTSFANSRSPDSFGNVSSPASRQRQNEELQQLKTELKLASQQLKAAEQALAEAKSELATKDHGLKATALKINELEAKNDLLNSELSSVNAHRQLLAAQVDAAKRGSESGKRGSFMSPDSLDGSKFFNDPDVKMANMEQKLAQLGRQLENKDKELTELRSKHKTLANRLENDEKHQGLDHNSSHSFQSGTNRQRISGPEDKELIELRTKYKNLATAYERLTADYEKLKGAIDLTSSSVVSGVPVDSQLHSTSVNDASGTKPEVKDVTKLHTSQHQFGDKPKQKSIGFHQSAESEAGGKSAEELLFYLQALNDEIKLRESRLADLESMFMKYGGTFDNVHQRPLVSNGDQDASALWETKNVEQLDDGKKSIAGTGSNTVAARGQGIKEYSVGAVSDPSEGREGLLLDELESLKSKYAKLERYAKALKSKLLLDSSSTPGLARSTQASISPSPDAPGVTLPNLNDTNDHLDLMLGMESRKSADMNEVIQMLRASNAELETRTGDLTSQLEEYRKTVAVLQAEVHRYESELQKMRAKMEKIGSSNASKVLRERQINDLGATGLSSVHNSRSISELINLSNSRPGADGFGVGLENVSSPNDLIKFTSPTVTSKTGLPDGYDKTGEQLVDLGESFVFSTEAVHALLSYVSDATADLKKMSMIITAKDQATHSVIAKDSEKDLESLYCSLDKSLGAITRLIKEQQENQGGAAAAVIGAGQMDWTSGVHAHDCQKLYQENVNLQLLVNQLRQDLKNAFERLQAQHDPCLDRKDEFRERSRVMLADTLKTLTSTKNYLRNTDPKVIQLAGKTRRQHGLRETALRGSLTNKSGDRIKQSESAQVPVNRKVGKEAALSDGKGSAGRLSAGQDARLDPSKALKTSGQRKSGSSEGQARMGERSLGVKKSSGNTDKVDREGLKTEVRKESKTGRETKMAVDPSKVTEKK